MTPSKEPPMTTQLPPHELRGFLAALADEPADPDRRLVFADWLEEHDDPRGELIRWQVQQCREKGVCNWDFGVSQVAPRLRQWRQQHQQVLGLDGLGITAWYWGRV